MSRLGCYSYDEQTFKAGELFQIHPCQHTSCPGCIVNGLLLKKRYKKPYCPGCFGPSSHHIYQNETVDHEEYERVNEIGKEKDPFRYFSYNQQKGKMLIALIDWSLESANSDHPKRMVAMFHQEEGAVKKSDEQEMIEILIKLCVYLLAGTLTSKSVGENPRLMSPHQWKRSHDIKEDKENARIDSKIKSRILANGVIVDMVLRLNSIDAIKSVQTGVKLDSRGFALALCDHVDYTGHAEKDHWTHFLLANNSKDAIKHDGAFEWQQWALC
eukprot:jgi/Psemu1/23399/gm1.23399_g